MLATLKSAFEAQDLVFLGLFEPKYAPPSESNPGAYDRFTEWLGEHKHAGMSWLENHAHVRKDPALLLEGSQAVISFALPYFHDLPDGPKVARYAQFADYHKLLKTKAEAAITEWKADQNGEEFDFRVVVDSAPVLERALVAQASDVFVGKNTCLIHEHKGSFLLLGEVFLTRPLSPTGGPEFDSTKRNEGKGCGPCTSCQTACPTGALDRDYQIDASKCLAYWTIEHRGTIPLTYWPWLAEFWYGCDLCQTACPYNGRAEGNRLPSPIALREMPALDRVAMMSQAEYEQFFGGTPMTRAKREGLRRNAFIAMVATQHPQLPQVIKSFESEKEPVLVETLAQVRDYRSQREETTSPTTV